MERVLIGTAAGGIALYLFYLLQKGESPKIAQRVSSTVPRAVRDPKIEPSISGSASSVVTAIANSGLDQHLDSRPTELGGDQASTGADQPEPTTTTLEQASTPIQPTGFCENPAFMSATRGDGPRYALKTMNESLGDDAAAHWEALGHPPDVAAALASHNCAIDFEHIVKIDNIPAQNIAGLGLPLTVE